MNNGDMVDMAGWHGYIELNDFKIVIDSGEEDSPAFATGLKKPEADAMMGDGMMPDIVKTVNDSLETAHSGLVVTAPDIVAKLKNGPLFLKIFAAPGQVADLVEAIEGNRVARSRATVRRLTPTSPCRPIRRSSPPTLPERTEQGAAASTVRAARAAIGAAHRDAGDDPTAHDGVRQVLAGLGRQSRRARPWPGAGPHGR